MFIYGQDIANFGGAFKATKGLAERFPGRVVDSPISEDAMMGLAIGAAIEGMRPIIEMQFADFSSVAFNQIVNNAATHFWRTGVALPIVVRLPSGGTVGSGPFHSQSMEAIYAHYPGLVVATPATVEDAYGLLLQSIALDDPVLFCEHKFLYFHLKSKGLPDPKSVLPIGKAKVMRNGRHATVVAYSAMVHEALRAAEELEADGWKVEVVDLRTIKPLDMDTVLRIGRPHRPRPLRRRSISLRRRHRRGRIPNCCRWLPPTRCSAPKTQRARHPDPLSSEPLESPPPDLADHRRRPP